VAGGSIIQKRWDFSHPRKKFGSTEKTRDEYSWRKGRMQPRRVGGGKREGAKSSRWNKKRFLYRFEKKEGECSGKEALMTVCRGLEKPAASRGKASSPQRCPKKKKKSAPEPPTLCTNLKTKEKKV